MEINANYTSNNIFIDGINGKIQIIEKHSPLPFQTEIAMETEKDNLQIKLYEDEKELGEFEFKNIPKEQFFLLVIEVSKEGELKVVLKCNKGVTIESEKKVMIQITKN